MIICASQVLSISLHGLRVSRRCSPFLLLLLASIPILSQNQNAQAKPKGEEPTPEAAIPAIVAAFDKYEVVGMSEAHGLKDADDFVFTLIRTPAFIEKVNDLVVECGNSLYQPTLDRYIAGEDVSFAEVRKAWRNTTQQMCSTSGFFEQFFPLVRAINQKLPPGKRIRVLAGDSPIDWDRVKTTKDIGNLVHDRDQNIASVMEKEVLSKHRKALMLFGVFHLMHTSTFFSDSAVTIYEKQYPNSTFVICGLESLDMNTPLLSASPFPNWPTPSLARAKGTWLGALELSHFFPPPIIVRKCIAKNEFPQEGQDKPMGDLVDAFLYLGPPALALQEQMPADIVLDSEFVTELTRRGALLGSPWSVKDASLQVLKSAMNPLLDLPKPADDETLRSMEKECREMKRRMSIAQ